MLSSQFSRAFSTAIKHVRGTRSGPGRFLIFGNESSEFCPLSTKLSGYDYPFSKGIISSCEELDKNPSKYNNTSEFYAPGYEAELDKNPDSIFIVSNHAPAGVPTAGLEYSFVNSPAGGVYMDVFRTFVPEQMRGQGVAGQLMKEAVDFATTYGYQIKPSCSYAETYIEKNIPELKYSA